MTLNFFVVTGRNQGDPLAMSMYTVSLVPVIQNLRSIAKHVDSTAAGD